MCSFCSGIFLCCGGWWSQRHSLGIAKVSFSAEDIIACFCWRYSPSFPSCHFSWVVSSVLCIKWLYYTTTPIQCSMYRDQSYKGYEINHGKANFKLYIRLRYRKDIFYQYCKTFCKHNPFITGFYFPLLSIIYILNHIQ